MVEFILSIFYSLFTIHYSRIEGVDKKTTFFVYFLTCYLFGHFLDNKWVNC